MLHNKIPSILGVFVLVLGLATGVILIGQQQVFRLGASVDATPADLRISNVTDTSFTASWTTAKDVVGHVSWGQTASLGQLARPDNTSPARIHSVTVKNLTPGSNYFFVVNSGGTEFDNNGVPWSVQTGPSLGTATSTTLASGRVVDSDGSPASNVLVYINGGTFAQLSTTTSLNGTWTIPLSTARTKTLTAYANPASDSVLEIFIQGRDNVSTAQALVSHANPIPDTALGHTYDFRDNAVGGNTGLPEADVNLPEDNDEAELEELGPGGLDLSGSNEEDDVVEVTLESINEPGEIIFTTSPEFFGEGPPNEEITITVESDPITDELRVSPTGTWRWSPPNDLEEGEHKITLKWTDAQGFLRTLTRTFVVQAAEGEPSFESTPSGATSTPAPTPSPTPSPTPTKSPTPSPTPTVSPTITPTRASIPSTESGLPEAGSLTPTLLLGTIGLVLFFSGIVISKKNS